MMEFAKSSIGAGVIMWTLDTQQQPVVAVGQRKPGISRSGQLSLPAGYKELESIPPQTYQRVLETAIKETGEETNLWVDPERIVYAPLIWHSVEHTENGGFHCNSLYPLYVSAGERQIVEAADTPEMYNWHFWPQHTIEGAFVQGQFAYRHEFLATDNFFRLYNQGRIHKYY